MPYDSSAQVRSLPWISRILHASSRASVATATTKGSSRMALGSKRGGFFTGGDLTTGPRPGEAQATLSGAPSANTGAKPAEAERWTEKQATSLPVPDHSKGTRRRRRGRIVDDALEKANGAVVAEDVRTRQSQRGVTL